MKICPIILSGGAGTRLWPLSRTLFPKQFLNLVSDQSLFVDTVSRVSGLDLETLPPLVVCNEAHRFLVAQQLQEGGFKHSGILLEPCGKNTAPAIMLAAAHLKKRYAEDVLMLVLPADHVIHYTDDITFSSSSLLNKFGDLYSKEQELFIRKIVEKHSFESINLKLEEIKKLKVLIIGETIIDQYVFCEALGKSGKEPVLVLRDLETQEYLGGALAIARHLNEFCDTVSVLSFLGENNEYKSFIEDSIERNIQLNYLTKSNSPTIIKRRFVDNVDRKIILGVYSINDSSLTKREENKFIESFDRLVKEHDLVIISDYGHGIITPKIANYISETDKFFSLNAQVNAANIGTHNIRKYHDINCLIINANELRHEMRQREGDLNKMAMNLKK